MKYKDVNWSSWGDRPEESTYNDWLKVRSKKGAAMTQTAIDRTAPHIRKLALAGVSAEEAVSVAVEDPPWIGIKYQWVMNAISRDMDGLADFAPMQLEQRSTRDISQKEMLTNDEWAK